MLFRIILFLVALNFLMGNISGLMPQLGRLSGFFLLLIWGGVYYPRYFNPFTSDRRNITICSIVLFLISLGLLLTDSFILPGIGLFVVAVYLFSFFEKDTDTEDKQNSQKKYHFALRLFLYTIVFYSFFHILYKYCPQFWYIVQKASLFFSALISSFIGEKVTLGPTASGFFITISVFCFCCSIAVYSKRKFLTLFFAVLTLIIMNGVYLWLQPVMIGVVHFFDKTVKLTPLNFQVMQLVCLLPAVYSRDIYLRIYAKFQKISIETSPLSLRNNIYIAFTILIICMIFTAGFFLTFYKTGQKEQGIVLFCDKGAQWSVPVYSKRFGQNSMGRFGLLPHYLKLHGKDAIIWKKQLSEKILKTSKVLVVFNPREKFTTNEKQLIYKFVENGGSLLVAGDHTDVSGVMGPINDLIKPFNITMNFDTALPINFGWTHSLEKRYHPVTALMEEENDASIWVGASLSITPDIKASARPVIVGKQGWADKGNYANIKRAYLGDYKRDGGEQLGDVILVADAVYGKGKVIVFGDTSSFQNGVLPVNYEVFIENLFNWLASSEDINFPLLQMISIFLLLISAIFIFYYQQSIFILLLYLIALYLPVLINCPITTTYSNYSFTPVATKYKKAVIDISHVERFSVYSPADNSLWGLYLNLMRNNYAPVFMKKFSKKFLDNANLLLIVAPTIEFNASELSILKEYMQNGGTIFYTVGWEEMAASKSFLKEFNLTIDSVPLGSAVVQAGKIKAKFVEAWPVNSKLLANEKDTVQILAKKYGYPIIVYQKVGRGGLMLIGDSAFFLSKNIESYNKHNLGNIQYTRLLLNNLPR